MPLRRHRVPVAPGPGPGSESLPWRTTCRRSALHPGADRVTGANTTDALSERRGGDVDTMAVADLDSVAIARRAPPVLQKLDDW